MSSSVTMPADSTQADHRRRYQNKTKSNGGKQSKNKARVSSRDRRRKQPQRPRHRKESRHRHDSDSEDDDDYQDADLDLTKELQSISSYVKQPDNMVEHMFRSISRKKLKAMLPPILKGIDVTELKSLCVQQLEGMSRKRVRKLLDGIDAEAISSSGTEDEVSDGPADVEGVATEVVGESMAVDSTVAADGTRTEPAVSAVTDDATIQPADSQKSAESSGIAEKPDSGAVDEEEEDEEEDYGVTHGPLSERQAEKDQSKIVRRKAPADRSYRRVAEDDEDKEGEEMDVGKPAGEVAQEPGKEIVGLTLEEIKAAEGKKLVDDETKSDDGSIPSSLPSLVSEPEYCGGSIYAPGVRANKSSDKLATSDDAVAQERSAENSDAARPDTEAVPKDLCSSEVEGVSADGGGDLGANNSSSLGKGGADDDPALTTDGASTPVTKEAKRVLEGILDSIVLGGDELVESIMRPKIVKPFYDESKLLELEVDSPDDGSEEDGSLNECFDDEKEEEEERRSYASEESSTSCEEEESGVKPDDSLHSKSGDGCEETTKPVECTACEEFPPLAPPVVSPTEAAMEVEPGGMSGRVSPVDPVDSSELASHLPVESGLQADVLDVGDVMATIRSPAEDVTVDSQVTSTDERPEERNDDRLTADNDVIRFSVEEVEGVTQSPSNANSENVEMVINFEGHDFSDEDLTLEKDVEKQLLAPRDKVDQATLKLSARRDDSKPDAGEREHSSGKRSKKSRVLGKRKSANLNSADLSPVKMLKVELLDIKQENSEETTELTRDAEPLDSVADGCRVEIELQVKSEPGTEARVKTAAGTSDNACIFDGQPALRKGKPNKSPRHKSDSAPGKIKLGSSPKPNVMQSSDSSSLAAVKSESPRQSLADSDEAVEDGKTSSSLSKTQLEILELEMRARAIKAMLKAQEELEKHDKRQKSDVVASRQAIVARLEAKQPGGSHRPGVNEKLMEIARTSQFPDKHSKSNRSVQEVRRVIRSGGSSAAAGPRKPVSSSTIARQNRAELGKGDGNAEQGFVQVDPDHRKVMVGGHPSRSESRINATEQSRRIVQNPVGVPRIPSVPSMSSRVVRVHATTDVRRPAARSFGATSRQVVHGSSAPSEGNARGGNARGGNARGGNARGGNARGGNARGGNGDHRVVASKSRGVARKPKLLASRLGEKVSDSRTVTARRSTDDEQERY